MHLNIAKPNQTDINQIEAINREPQPAKLKPRANCHRLLCLLVSFCLGLVACVSIVKLEAKQDAYKQFVSSAGFSVVCTPVETGDKLENQHTQNGISRSTGQLVGHGLSKPCKIPNMDSPEGPVSQSLTSLGIRLQI
ncbi:MAG: hypothetical protein ACI87E_002100 [Mariniblastus sp.]|jgi:hypothetical protein